jgi:hypothetical protein
VGEKLNKGEKEMIRVIKKYDIRPVDPDTGRRIAISEVDVKECACCGRRIVKVAELSTGHIIGQNCALYVERPDILEMVINGTAQGRITKKMNNFFSANNLIK